MLLPLHLLSISLSFVLSVSALDIYHRLYIPFHPPPPFTLRGTVQINDLTASYIPAFSDDNAQIAAEVASSTDKGALYQLAIQRDSFGMEGEEYDWAYSSVKACHAAVATEEYITLPTTSSGTIYAITYHVMPVPKDGLCPSTSASPTLSSLSLNTTVNIRRPDPIPILELRPPPVLSAQGEPVKVEPEQSFIQKYWMYMVPALLLIMLAPAAAEEPAAGGGGDKK